MGLFDLFKTPDINQGLKESASIPGAVLLDVRTPEEYQEGHIPGSINLPLQMIGKAEEHIGNNKNLPIFVYCHSGARSRQAVDILRKMGYANVKNIGGIASYTGKVER